MTAPALIRWGALSAILAGLLWVIAELWLLLVEGLGIGTEPFSQMAARDYFVATMGLGLLSTVLLLFSLVGFNLHQSEEATGGVLRGLGFVVAFFGTAMTVGSLWSLLFVGPAVAVQAPTLLDSEGPVAGILGVVNFFSFLVMVVGWAVFGVGTLRARSYPRWVSIALIIGALLQLALVNGSSLLFGVAVALLGYFTLVGGRMSVEQTSRV
jgi:hypothetical protein